jgi:hypothetical protein
MTDKVSGKLIASFKAMLNKYRIAEKPKGPKGPVAPATGNAPVKAFEKNGLHPYLRRVKDEHSFKLKTNHNSTIAEIHVIEGLRDCLRGAPDEAIVFHMTGRNDFASWVKDCVGDWWLGSRIEKVELADPATTRAHLVRALDDRIARLRAH